MILRILPLLWIRRLYQRRNGRPLLFKILLGCSLLSLVSVIFIIPSIIKSDFIVTKNVGLQVTVLPKLPETFTLQDPENERIYFTKRKDGVSCSTAGTLLNESFAFINSACNCRPGFYGTDCGIPESVWETACPFLPGKCSELKVREKPRRLIHGINVNHELEFFEMRLEEVGDVVDVFIVGESNITAGGDPSQLYLLPKLRQGFMSHFQHKILHVFIDHFPEKGYTDGWFAQTFIRDYMGQEGLKRIKDVRDDDLFLFLDADEIPNRDVLLFLKLYDGYPEPIALTFRWSVYGFFWKRTLGFENHEEDVTRVVAISTLAMINQVYDGQVGSLRRNELQEEPFSSRISQYVKDDKKKVEEWNIGSTQFYAGFHCSWCYRPEGIRLKLMAAQKDDKPRWGDYPEKLDLTYIAGLIEKGTWFDGSNPFFLVKPQSGGDKNYAPQFVWRNKERFNYLLNHSHSIG